VRFNAPVSNHDRIRVFPALRPASAFRVVFIALLCAVKVAHGEDLARVVRKAAERSTLNQPGTKPFHLKATLAPSFERDAQAGLTGDIEVWWASPTRWKREIHTPQFSQVAIVNGDREWQKNEGDYFPEWLREVAVALVEPVPNLNQVLDRVKGCDVRTMMGQMNCSWMEASSDGHVASSMGAGIALNMQTGLLNYGSGLGWGAELQHYQDFHGRQIARTVKSGHPGVTATVTVLEDLGNIPPSFLDAGPAGASAEALRTAVVDEISLRKNLVPGTPVTWPAMKDGPLEGVLSATVVIDRSGMVREVGTIVSANPMLSDTARQFVQSMRFKPYLLNGEPVQVVSRLTIPFKTTRPAGMESFDSARSYFERARKIGFPAASGSSGPYVLHAEFTMMGRDGQAVTGHYADTWVDDAHWRREAWLGSSHYVRSCKGDQRYEFGAGQDAALLKFVVHALEPIPAIDTFVESDWRIKRDPVAGGDTVRVFTGYESPDGRLDAVHSRGYWFDPEGQLVKTFFAGLETRRSDFEEFHGAQIAHRINVYKDGKLGVEIRVADITAATGVPGDTFEVRGHKTTRAFTDEVR
jgi:hypothetical protein